MRQVLNKYCPGKVNYFRLPGDSKRLGRFTHCRAYEAPPIGIDVGTVTFEPA